MYRIRLAQIDRRLEVLERLNAQPSLSDLDRQNISLEFNGLAIFRALLSHRLERASERVRP